MSLGLVGVAQLGTLATNSVLAVAAPVNGAVRVFDFILNTTAGTVDFYAGTTSANGVIVHLDTNTPLVHSTAGYRFIGGVFVATSLTSTYSASINYIKEF